jgi:hypothetical protein
LTPYFSATLLVAQTEAQDKRLALRRAVASDPELAQRYFDTVAGILPLEKLYTPELMALLAKQSEARPVG